MPLAHHPLLAAGLDELLQVWLPIIFGALYMIAQMVGNLQEQRRKAARPPRPKPDPIKDLAGPDLKPADPAKPATLEETLRREVEEFLRRAQGNEPAKEKRPPPPAPKPKPRLEPSGQTRTRPPQPRPAPLPPPQPIRTLAPVPAPMPADRAAKRPEPFGSNLGQLTAEHLRGARDIAEHSRRLGADVAQADERLAEHLRDKFVHPISTLAASTGPREAQPAAASASSAAAALRAMLASPTGAKQLIIAAEILRRPEV